MSKREIDPGVIRRAQDGDRLAFRELFEHYREDVARVAYQMVGNWEDARDIAQEVFIKIFRSLNQFDPRRRFFTWLYRLTVNASIDFLRRRKRHPEYSSLESAGNGPPTVGEAAGSLESREMMDIFKGLAQKLNPKQRSAFVLCDLEGFSPAEAAGILRVPRATLRWQLHQARKRLKDGIIKKYPEYLPG
ncbi:RNA polymerase sigma factor [candidate division KSB1 bacterium]|nr:RNA polymerase sigma factor [candidate division KSB1 bacterium]